MYLRPASASYVTRPTLCVLHKCILKHSRDGKACVFTPGATFNTLDEKASVFITSACLSYTEIGKACAFTTSACLKHFCNSKVCSHHKCKLETLSRRKKLVYPPQAHAQNTLRRASLCVHHKRILSTLDMGKLVYSLQAHV